MTVQECLAAVPDGSAKRILLYGMSDLHLPLAELETALQHAQQVTAALRQLYQCLDAINGNPKTPLATTSQQSPISMDVLFDKPGCSVRLYNILALNSGYKYKSVDELIDIIVRDGPNQFMRQHKNMGKKTMRLLLDLLRSIKPEAMSNAGLV